MSQDKPRRGGRRPSAILHGAPMGRVYHRTRSSVLAREEARHQSARDLRAAFMDKEIPDDANPTTLLKLPASACAFPVGCGDDGVSLFCGAPAVDGRSSGSYCAHHYARAYTAPEEVTV